MGPYVRTGERCSASAHKQAPLLTRGPWALILHHPPQCTGGLSPAAGARPRARPCPAIDPEGPLRATASSSPASQERSLRVMAASAMARPPAASRERASRLRGAEAGLDLPAPQAKHRSYLVCQPLWAFAQPGRADGPHAALRSLVRASRGLSRPAWHGIRPGRHRGWTGLAPPRAAPGRLHAPPEAGVRPQPGSPSAWAVGIPQVTTRPCEAVWAAWPGPGGPRSDPGVAGSAWRPAVPHSGRLGRPAPCQAGCHGSREASPVHGDPSRAGVGRIRPSCLPCDHNSPQPRPAAACGTHRVGLQPAPWAPLPGCIMVPCPLPGASLQSGPGRVRLGGRAGGQGPARASRRCLQPALRPHAARPSSLRHKCEARGLTRAAARRPGSPLEADCSSTQPGEHSPTGAACMPEWR